MIKAGEGFDTFRDALKKIEQNNAASFTFPEYTPPVPRLLSVAWNYQFRAVMDFMFVFQSGFFSMCSAIGAYADYVARVEKDLAEAERACDILIACGEKIAGNLPSVQEFYQDKGTLTLSFLGNRVLALKGYETMTKLSDLMPPDRVAAFDARYRAFKERQAVWGTQFGSLNTYSSEAYLLY